MGQEDIIEALLKEGKPLSRKEIAELTDYRDVQVSKFLKQLVKFKEVKAIEVDRVIAKKKYNCKRRMKIYYV